MTAVPTRPGGACVCVCVCTSGFGSVSRRRKKTENIAQSHGREVPSLELIREPLIGERNGVGSVSRKLSLDPAALQYEGVIGISWRYIVHIRRVSQNHWNVMGMFLLALPQPVFTLVWGAALL